MLGLPGIMENGIMSHRVEMAKANFQWSFFDHLRMYCDWNLKEFSLYANCTLDLEGILSTEDTEVQIVNTSCVFLL